MNRRLPCARRAAPVFACIGLLAVWQVASLALKNDSFPTAIEAIRAIPDILGDKESLINILASLRRMAIGFSVAVLVSIPLGLLMGRSRAVAAFFNPLLMVIYPVPKAALMPIIMLWLGVGDITKTLVIFLGVSLPVIYHSFEGAKAVEEKMLWSGAAMGLSPLQRLVRIVLPAALPEILTGCRTGLVLALITMITSEMIARQSGAGNILFNALDMGAIRHRLRDDHHHRRDGNLPRCGLRAGARTAGALVRAAVRHAVELLMNARVSLSRRRSRARANRAGDRGVAGPGIIRLSHPRSCCRRRDVFQPAAPATRDIGRFSRRSPRP